VRDAHAVEREDEAGVRPALGARTRSCSEATPTTSPIGESWRPAVERRIAGSPSIASTPLWSVCSCATSSRSAATPAIGG